MSRRISLRCSRELPCLLHRARTLAPCAAPSIPEGSLPEIRLPQRSGIEIQTTKLRVCVKALALPLEYRPHRRRSS
jgi:hypothetical protein